MIIKRERRLEEGIHVGNQVDKSALRNPISRLLVNGFDERLIGAARALAPASIHEVGCGEARLARKLRDQLKVPVHGTDFSEQIIADNARHAGSGLTFERLSIYDLDPQTHRRDVVLCCEVLEHLEQPERGLAKLKALDARAYIVSVPREPIWRALNLARGKYVMELGNTPGHLNHWSIRTFGRFLAAGGFEPKAWLNPFPWIMAVAVPAR